MLAILAAVTIVLLTRLARRPRPALYPYRGKNKLTRRHGDTERKYRRKADTPGGRDVAFSPPVGAERWEALAGSLDLAP